MFENTLIAYSCAKEVRPASAANTSDKHDFAAEKSYV